MSPALIHRRLFDDQLFSDLTIRFSGYEIKAHKAIVSQASDYFTSALAGSFCEADSNVLNLHDDNPAAVKGLIAYMYGLNLDGHGVYSRDAFDVTSDEEGAGFVMSQIDLAVTAMKVRDGYRLLPCHSRALPAVAAA